MGRRDKAPIRRQRAAYPQRLSSSPAGIRASETTASPSHAAIQAQAQWYCTRMWMHMSKPGLYRMHAIHSLTVAGAAQVGSPRHSLVPNRCFPFNCAHREGVREHQISRECRYMGFARQGSAAGPKACGIFFFPSYFSLRKHVRSPRRFMGSPIVSPSACRKKANARASRPAGRWTLAMSRAWLIGAGPGDAELITVKAMRALALADVVLVDDLVNPEILDMARADAQIVHVGKRGGGVSTPQDEIMATMLAHLEAGRSVARLKGGDPFVFGRGGEELLALQDAGIRTEVISGVTAGIAAPATLGIPVTHRGMAQGAIFVTGHSAGEQEPDWAALAATGLTIVIYMGIRRLDDIAEALLRAGMAAHTPCVAIESATLPTQRQVMAPLDTLSFEVRRAGLGSPAILVIGSVAALARMDNVALRGQQALTIGIGFRQGVAVEQIDAAVSAALKPYSMADVACVATLESKAQEPALVAFCEHHRLPLVAFAPRAVQACFDRHSSLRRSAVVHAQVGVEGVCEPCALLAAPGGKLVRSKRALGGVTVAIAASAQQDRARQEREQEQGHVQGNHEDRH